MKERGNKPGNEGSKSCSMSELATASPETQFLAQSCEIFLAGREEHN